MKGMIRWTVVSPDTFEFHYNMGSRDFNCEDSRGVVDIIIDLLNNEWTGFGESGDCIVIGLEDD